MCSVIYTFRHSIQRVNMVYDCNPCMIIAYLSIINPHKHAHVYSSMTHAGVCLHQFFSARFSPRMHDSFDLQGVLELCQRVWGGSLYSTENTRILAGRAESLFLKGGHGYTYKMTLLVTLSFAGKLIVIVFAPGNISHYNCVVW